ncbi:hypothetical protein CC80DRAFT_492772 [Byssothecium circinans]|uniref:Uncharacterized protein n=1 Tax=Byssothecium circinans TaxID=147558 RepID=A0A6A5TUX1_9PLEO|nr:hypothetical protein CC80DRAFT_492772 [Byssothecium circinans]
MSTSGATPIIDIRVGGTDFDILQDVRNGLRPQHGGQKTLPTLLLYDEAGLRLFEKITYLEEYYLTNAEIEVLERYADRIAERIEPGSVVVELGSGNLRKVNILLQAIERQGKEVEYYAVDLSLPELERTFAEVPTEGYKHIQCFGLHGTYAHALEWLKSPQMSARPKTILWLGSSLGNFKRHEVPPFLSGFRAAIKPGDTMLIGIDACKNSDKVFHAYNDREKVTREFTLNGLKHANRLLGETVFNLDDWDTIGEYDVENGCHRAFVSPLKDVEIDGVRIAKGERLRIEESYKYSRKETERLWDEAGLVENSVWCNKTADYALHLVVKPPFFFSAKPEAYAAEPVPGIAAWRELWVAWDAISQNMIPKDKLLSKPIKLRNVCLFYLGHIPTFLDIHLTRASGQSPTEPVYYQKIFERGIDPDVDNPDHCHPHSETPENWPALEDILGFQDRVRTRVHGLYDSGVAQSDPKISYALWLGFEHEAMHLETLLYMLIQSEKVLPPPGSTVPDFEALAKRSEALAVDNQWFTIPESDISIGLDKGGDTEKHHFGWDNEQPRRSAHVLSFRAKGRPITNGEYATFLASTGKTTMPVSWCETSQPTITRDSVMNGQVKGSSDPLQRLTEGKYVRTVYGAIPLHYALHWPVVASYNELASCASWMGGRIPTMEEARSIYNYVEHGATQVFEKALGNTIPAVNGHLINNGVDETPPSQQLRNGGSNAAARPKPHDLFFDLEGTNTAFQHWHPVSVVEKGDKLCGQSDMGGVWEWTSTVLEKHEGFEAMPLYPGYTADFFDGKHNIVLGGSWATHSRIAGRKTFTNWYQRNYPYVWATARIVEDV